MKIRRTIEDDIPTLCRIVSDNYSKLFAEHFTQEALCSFFPYPFRPHFLTAEQDGAPVGCGCWTTDWLSWGVFNLSWVNVARSVQRQGIGRALVDALLAELRPQASYVLLATKTPDYYERHWGFCPLQKFGSNEACFGPNDGHVDVLMSLRFTDGPSPEVKT